MRGLKLEIGTLVTVDGIEARVIDVDDKHEPGQRDHLIKPLNFPTDNLCKCGSHDCGGSNWYLESEFTKDKVCVKS